MYEQHVEHAIHPQNRLRVEALVASLADYEQELAGGVDPQAAPIIAQAFDTSDLAALAALGREIAGRFKHVIVCGTGGSGLSGQVILALKPYIHQPQFYRLDNMDPSVMDAVLDQCPPADTAVIAISKSGGTVETLSQFYVLLAHFTAALGARAGEHFTIITMAGESPMRKSALEAGMRILDHPADIGGRFSLFTAVGLLPASLYGFDIAAMRAGAAAVFAQLGNAVHTARIGAALQYAAMEKGCNQSVLLPYCDRLSVFGQWYRQGWAESLGKSGKGTTPIPAIGTTDQHSQLQLYLGGPKDKFFTLIFHRRAKTGQPICAPALAGLEYLAGKTTGDVMQAEQDATLATLVKHGCPVRLLEIETLDERTLGALAAHFMLEIFFMARLLGVNAFDQPAVEEGKQLARDALLAMSA